MNRINAQLVASLLIVSHLSGTDLERLDSRSRMARALREDNNVTTVDQSGSVAPLASVCC